MNCRLIIGFGRRVCGQIFVPSVREPFGFFHLKSHSWLCYMVCCTLVVRDDLLEELS